MPSQIHSLVDSQSSLYKDYKKDGRQENTMTRICNTINGPFYMLLILSPLLIKSYTRHDAYIGTYLLGYEQVNMVASSIWRLVSWVLRSSLSWQVAHHELELQS